MTYRQRSETNRALLFNPKKSNVEPYKKLDFSNIAKVMKGNTLFLVIIHDANQYRVGILTYDSTEPCVHESNTHLTSFL